MSELAPLARLLGLAPPLPEPPREDAVEAYAAGFADGIAEAEARHAAELAAQQAAQEEGRRAAEAAFDRLLADAADCLAEAGLAIAAAVLGTRPAIPADTLRALVAEALAAAPAGATGTLRLPAALPPAAQAALPAGWRIVVDPGLAPGEVRAELPDRAILASLEARLADLARLLAAQA